MSRLPAGFAARPFAHRGLHDAAAGVPENSRAAVQAAVAAGYGVEIDVQLSADGEAVVFHDDTLERLTGERGPVSGRRAAELGALVLKGSGETIPTLAEVLALLPAETPALIEIKDQGGRFDATGVGPLETRVAALLDGAPQALAVMSFNPESVAAFARLAPGRARGLVAGGGYRGIVPWRAARLAGAEAVEAVGADFVSFHHAALPSPRSRALHEAGVAVLCWTIRSPAEAAAVAPHADAITFEGFRP
jgi:glycerophosphoryl diester phosphodiesterase